MCGRVLSLLLVTLSFASPALPSCNWVSRYSGQFRSTAFDVAVDGEGFVWVATGYGVQLLEPVAGGVPRFADSVAVAGSTRVLAISGSLAYVGSGARVYVVRRNGSALEVVRSVDAGATVNDLVVFSTYLFVATTNGLAHFDLFDRENPNRTTVLLLTTAPNVRALAVSGSTLYAADGDVTIEIFTLASPALPQKTGTLESLNSSVSVHTIPGNILFVSDSLGQNSDIFINDVKLGRVPYGTSSFAPLTSETALVAGINRSIRAVDIGTGAERYEYELAPTGGTSNRIFAIARSGNVLYVAAGDIGLAVLDLAPLATPPHPLLSNADGAKSSVLLASEKAYFINAGGAISEMTIERAGISMRTARGWNIPAGSVLHDQTATTLLSANGAFAKIWSIATMAQTFSATFPATIRSATLTGNTIVALLTDGNVWRAPLDGTAPSQVALGGAKMTFLARSGTAIALAEITEDGKTNIRYYATGDLAAPTRTFTLNGAATGGLALNATHAAIFTFGGINAVDLASGNVRVFAQSNRLIPRQLLFSGNDLLVLSDRTLAVWHGATGVLQREHPLPAGAIAMHAAAPLAVIASSDGSMILDYTALLPVPSAVMSNQYYDEAVAAGEHLYLFDDGRVDIYWTAQGSAPRFTTTVDASGALDIAALPKSFFTLSANMRVTAYSTAGAQLAQVTIDEGVDAEPLSITTAGDAVWVTIARGCLSGTCQRKTLVLDPTTLAVTASMNGGASEVVTEGTRAYALFELPDEVRVLNITNPLQPSQVVATASPAQASSVAFSAGTVLVLADKVYAYNESLLPAGEFLSSVAAREWLAVDGDCATILGGTAELFTLPSWSGAPMPIEIPSVARAIALQPGRLYVLTEHSIEVWTTAPPPAPTRRRATR